jgi:hypothetical protein
MTYLWTGRYPVWWILCLLTCTRRREFPVYPLPKVFGFIQNLPDFGKTLVDLLQLVINLLTLLRRGHTLLETCVPRLKSTISINGKDTNMLDVHRLLRFLA